MINMRFTIVSLLKILGPLNIFVIPALMCLCLVAVFAIGSARDFISWRETTSPLPPQIQTDLCTKFSLLPRERLCRSDNVLARDFYPIISKTFPLGQATYEEVDAILGSYELRRSDLKTWSDGQNFYWVSYDLRGDEAYRIVFYFYEDGEMFRIQENYQGLD
jgi:hypothetical protein